MRVVVQRVKQASVTNDSINASIGKGLCLLVGVGQDSTEADVKAVAKKIANARIFEDEQGKMNLNVQKIGGSVLSISQFTLYADVKKGNRPGFTNSKAPDEANRLYEALNDELRQFDLEVKTGEFGTDMLVDIANDGPVTIIYESQDGKVI
ncbi:D-aminoacyl-tRNA deacylase [Staphylococcus sp. IVB6181]|uniref:D-aminoacyl-tRNA deacylase n=1 Tax=Staphylococcus sp. IVB6181 TaxID=2929481 RepID=UPI0021CDEC9C|nr:D-aminoacyl-tRNA deacylase [Staphylococcus sp. IVB6181]UXV33763.1 D-aminoacyl-tRNA deacylase [Staphylococcus sp. IVB6181]